MKQIFVISALLLLIVLVAFLGFIYQPEQQDQQAAIEAAVTATLTAQEAARLPPAPVLIGPADQAVFDNVAEVILEWTWFRPLDEGEIYDVRVWQEGEFPYGITWTEDEQFRLTDWLLYQAPGEYFWTVAVMRPGEDGADPYEISEVPPAQQFTVEAVTLNIMDVPPGFKADLYARLPMPHPTVIEFGPEGDLYVLSMDGEIVRLWDEDGDDFAESFAFLYDNADELLLHSVGMALYEGEIYISDSGRVSVFRDTDEDGLLDTLDVLVEGLPSWEYPLHSNNGIAFGPDDKLYIAIGSTTDHGPLRREYESSILRMNPDGSDLEVFATGFRNPYDLAFSPDGELFTADNSPDSLGHTMQYLPPEELNYVREGQDYGFPEVYGHPPAGHPSEAPVTEFFTSSASSGLVYYAADHFPEDYHGVYVAQFGTGASYPKSLGLQTGERVVFVPLEPTEDGGYTGTWQVFADFPSQNSNYSPIDLTVGPDGALYIAEWTTATIYRVVYTGEFEAAETITLISDADEAVLTVGEDLYHNGFGEAPACNTCHLLQKDSSSTGPSLVNLHESAAERVEGLNATAYVRQSIIDPNAYITSGYTANFMYPNYGQVLDDAQIDALVAYVLALSVLD